MVLAADRGVDGPFSPLIMSQFWPYHYGTLM